MSREKYPLRLCVRNSIVKKKEGKRILQLFSSFCINIRIFTEREVHNASSESYNLFFVPRGTKQGRVLKSHRENGST